MLKLKTDKDVIEFTRAIALSLAQTLHEKSTFYEPGRTYKAIEDAVNAWNAACIELVGVQGDKFILFARKPMVLLETNEEGKTEIWDFLRDFVEDQWGWKLLITTYNREENKEKDLKRYGDVWYLFGPDLEALLDDYPDRDKTLDTFFNTFNGTLRED